VRDAAATCEQAFWGWGGGLGDHLSWVVATGGWSCAGSRRTVETAMAMAGMTVRTMNAPRGPWWSATSPGSGMNSPAALTSRPSVTPVAVPGCGACTPPATTPSPIRPTCSLCPGPPCTGPSSAAPPARHDDVLAE
jgi:hypothetical protein